MYIVKVFFQISLNFVQNVTILPKIAKHGPIDHGIIANIFVIVMNYVPIRKMLYIRHDLKKKNWILQVFSNFLRFLHKMLIFTPKIAKFGYIHLSFIADIFS